MIIPIHGELKMIEDKSFMDLMSTADDGVYIVDLDRKILHWNRAAERISGYSADQVIGSSCKDNILRHISPEGVELCTNGCPLLATMDDRRVRDVDVYMHCKDGSRRAVMVRAAPLLDDKGEVIGAIEVFSDRSDRSLLLSEIEMLRHDVLTDPLTGLGNRRALSMIAESRFAAIQSTTTGFALLMADIDHFKKVNDVHGHDVGDRILKMVANTLGAAVRPLDAAVRWGGEEFILLCPNVTMENLPAIAERVRMVVEHSWIDLDDGTTLAVTISLGAALAKKDDTLEALVHRADERLYRAKHEGRNRCVVGE